MKILHIAEIHARVNGITEVVFRLSTEQQKLGHNVRIFTIANDAEVQNTETLLKIENIIHFYRNVKEWKPDIVILHTLYKLCYLEYAVIFRTLKIPYLIEAHGAMSYANQQKNAWKKKLANLLLYKQFIKFASAIVYLCTEERDNSIFRSLTNSVIIPNGVDIPKQIKLRVIDEKSFISIIYLGRFDIHHKGLDVLSESIAHFHNELLEKRIRILFYGYGIGEKKLREYLIPYKDVAEVCGPVYGEEKVNAYCKGNIFILTSRYEGFPMAILEALSFGLPCIVTPQTNMATLIANEHAGWVTQMNPENIAHTLLQAVDEYRKHAEKLQMSSRNSVQCYMWKDIAKKSVDIYKSFTTYTHES